MRPLCIAKDFPCYAQTASVSNIGHYHNVLMIITALFIPISFFRRQIDRRVGKKKTKEKLNLLK
jgi:hypothetical protein